MHKAARLPSRGSKHCRAQERFLIISPRELRDRILKIYNEDWDCPTSMKEPGPALLKIHHFGQVRSQAQGLVVCDVPIQHLTGGIRYQRREFARAKEALSSRLTRCPLIMKPGNAKDPRSPNIASREHIYRDYAYGGHGPTLSFGLARLRGLIAPVRGDSSASLLAVDSNPFYGRIRPLLGRGDSSGRGTEECLHR